MRLENDAIIDEAMEKVGALEGAVDGRNLIDRTKWQGLRRCLTRY